MLKLKGHGIARNTSAVGYARVLGTGRGSQENWCVKESVFSCGGSSTAGYRNDEANDRASLLETNEDLGQSVEVHCEGAARVPTVKFEAGQLMQWPDMKSDDVMMRGFMLESEMSPIGSVRRAAEPVSMAAKSEMFTPVFAGGGGGRCCGSPPGRGRGSHIF